QNESIDLGNGILRSEARLGVRHLREHETEVPFLSIGERVMHQISTLNGSQWKRSRNQNDRNMFAVRAGDAIDRAEGPDTVGHNQRANAVDSRISIGRIGRVELVAVSNPGGLTAVFELLHEFEVVVAGNTKDVPNTGFVQAAKQKKSNRFFH